MHRPRLGQWAAPSSSTARSKVGFVGPKVIRRIAPPPMKSLPVTVSPGIVRVPTSTGPVTIRTDFAPRDDFTAIPDRFRYSDDQIRDMRERGASETYERSGETDSGLLNSPELEQKANESDATKRFNRDSAGTIVPAGESTNGTTAKTDFRWILAAAAAYFMFA